MRAQDAIKNLFHENENLNSAKGQEIGSNIKLHKFF